MEPSTSKRKPGWRRTRFPQDAADIMLSFYHNVSTFPNETERVELAKKVRSAAPSCSHYTGYHVYQYFANLRHRAKNGFEPSLPGGGTTVGAAKSLDAPQCEEETRPSRKAAKRQKQKLQTSGGRPTAQDAKCHALHKTVQHSSASVAAEDELGKEPSSISPVSPRRATTSSDANGEHLPSQTDAECPNLDGIPTCTIVLSSSPPSTGQDDEPWTRIERPASASEGEGDPSHLIPQLHLVLSPPNARSDRHGPRARDTAHRSFAELATWLSAERRSAGATRLDSVLGG